VFFLQGYAWEAEHWFKKAIAVRPDFRGALFNLALLLTEEQRSLEAVPYLETLLKHYPQHIKVILVLVELIRIRTTVPYL
jgi:tetratricopeptide (TPR) repeat protein